MRARAEAGKGKGATCCFTLGAPPHAGEA